MSSNIDKIFYINLEKRYDRREQIEKELNDYGLNFERFNAIESPGIVGVGCGLSHLNVLKIAKERNYKNVLIFEDDFTFLISKEEFEKQLNDFFSLNLNYDVCMLSYNMISYEKTNYDFINKVLDAQTASGYIVNADYYDKLIEIFEWAMPLFKKTNYHWLYSCDIAWKKLQKNDNWYYFTKRIGKQRPSYSDNSECFTDYNC